MTTEQTPKPQSKVEKFLADIKKALEEKNKNAMFKAVTDVAGIESTEKALEVKVYAMLPSIMPIKSVQSISRMKVYECGKNNVMSKERANRLIIAQDAVTIGLEAYNKAGFGGRDEFLADMKEHIKTEKMNQLAQIRRHAQCARS